MAARKHTDGFAAPRLYIYNITKGKKTIVKNRHGREIGREAIKFSYEYNEEDDDTCTITFQTSDVKLPDLQALQIGRTLYVTWGFVNAEGKEILSPQRLIRIRDKESEFAADKITYTIKCTDIVSLLKNVQSTAVKNDNFIGFLDEIADGKYKANIIINSHDVIHHNDREPAAQKKDQIGNVILAIDKTAAPQEFYFKSTKIIKGKSNAITKAIEDKLAMATGGPYFLDGRDNVITIRNRNFAQKAVRDYEYNSEKGDIITFRPKTEIQKNDAANAEVAALEPGSKSISFNGSQTISMGDLVNGLDPISANENIQDDIDEYTEQTKIIFEERMRSGNTVVVDSEDYKEGDLTMLQDLQIRHVNLIDDDNDTKAPEAINGTYMYTEAVDNTAAPHQWIEEISYDIAPEIVFSSPKIRSDIKNMLDNEMRERQVRKHQAQITIIGDPFLVSSQVINVTGVSDIDSGHWYCTSVQHSIDTGKGYTTTAEMIKKPKEHLQNTGINEVKLNNDPESGIATGEQDLKYETVKYYSPVGKSDEYKNKEKIKTAASEVGNRDADNDIPNVDKTPPPSLDLDDYIK